MNKKLYMQKQPAVRTVRRPDAEASVDLSKRRAWFANNAVTYGFHQLADVYDRLVTDVEPDRIDSAVYDSAEIYARDLDAVFDELIEDTTERDGAFELPTSGELQPGSENGTPVPTQGYKEIVQGYPMWRGMDSFGFNREAYAKLTVRELDKLMLGVQNKDARWNFRRLFAAIFTNVSWTFKEPKRTDLTVRGLAVTGDGAIYMDQNGDMATANHYTSQSDPISDAANPYTAQESILRAHPANTGRIIQYIPPGLVDATKLLEGWHPFNPNDGLVDYGTDVDLASDIVAQYIGFGNEIVGVVSDSVIVLSRRLPAGYVVSEVLGVDKPLVRRQEPEAALQGLQVVPTTVDSNFRKVDFYRKAGFAVRNPIAMAVRQIEAGSYSIPAGYDARTIKG